MNEPGTPLPIAIDRVERGRGDGDDVRLRLVGHWLVSARDLELDALLVVQLQGRRHRFPARRARRDDPAPGSWAASFTVPDWAVPSEHGQASLWVGSATVPVPPPGVGPRDADLASSGPREPVADAVDPTASERPPGPVAHAFDPASAERASATELDPSGEPGRSGPLADLLYRNTVSALHAELEQRSTDAAQLRGALADARAELELHVSGQGALESTQQELRHELAELIAAAGEQRQALERELADARAQADAQVEELRGRLAGADERRRELESEREAVGGELARVGSELAAARDERAAQVALLEDRLATAQGAERLRAQEAGALREQLATAQVARDAAVSEAGGLRAELDRLGSELAVTRERRSAQVGDLDDAQRLLADARALTEQLRSRPGR